MNVYETDPEFVERVNYFISEEVKKEPGQELDDATRYLAVLAALVGCQGTCIYEEMLPRALDAGLSPVAVKEMVYQSVDYVGLGRMWPFLRITNEIMVQRGIPLPLEGQATADMEELRRLHERSLEGRPHKQMAGRQLFRRLLHKDRADSGPEGDDHVLFSGGSGRVRASAGLPCQREFECGK